MSELAAELANILSAVVTQIRRLSDDEVKALAAGEAEFRLVPKTVAPPRKAAAKKASTVESSVPSTVDFEVAPVKAELAGCATEADALAYLRGLKLNLMSAKALATGLGLRLPARPSVGNIQAEIIRVFVGGRLNAVTVQGL
jgi:hypothetical protein